MHDIITVQMSGDNYAHGLFVLNCHESFLKAFSLFSKTCLQTNLLELL